MSYVDDFLVFFFFNDTATTEIYTLSLHDALPICRRPLLDRPHERAQRAPAEDDVSVLMSTAGRQHWPRASQERAVERFYQPGVERYADYHGGMLNFGLWTDGVTDYRTASRKLIRRAATSIGLKAESRLLDVACGMGAQDVYLAQELGCRSIDGLDVTWKHVLAGRKRACDAGLEDRVRFHHGTAVDLPFADSSFTHVLCVEGAEHFDTRERFLHEVVRVVVPGGRIALTDFSMKRRPRTLVERLLRSEEHTSELQS